jgi:hypothetical protein
MRRPFANSLNLGDVIRLPNYETGNYDHDISKTRKANENIKTCSRENDLVVIPFAEVVRVRNERKENRNFVGFETKKHVDMSNKE